MTLQILLELFCILQQDYLPTHRNQICMVSLTFSYTERFYPWELHPWVNVATKLLVIEACHPKRLYFSLQLTMCLRCTGSLWLETSDAPCGIKCLRKRKIKCDTETKQACFVFWRLLKIDDLYLNFNLRFNLFLPY